MARLASFPACSLVAVMAMIGSGSLPMGTVTVGCLEGEGREAVAEAVKPANARIAVVATSATKNMVDRVVPKEFR